MGTATAGARTSASAIGEYDAIVKVVDHYCEGIKTGDIAVMKPAFHANAGFFGIYRGELMGGPIQLLYDVTQANGPSPDALFRITSVDVTNSMAVVKLECENYTGKMTDATGKMVDEVGNTLTDIFTLIKYEGTWSITQKSFHWHR